MKTPPYTWHSCYPKSYPQSSGFPTHKECDNFRNGIYMVNGVAVDPNRDACLSFTPKSMITTSQTYPRNPQPTFLSPFKPWLGASPSKAHRLSEYEYPRQPPYRYKGRRQYRNRYAGGRGMGGFRAEPGGYCVCPSCGHKTFHVRGTPCLQLICPRCGSRMTRA